MKEGEGGERRKRKGMAWLKVRFLGGVWSNLGQNSDNLLSHYRTMVTIVIGLVSIWIYFFAGALGFIVH